MSIAHNKIVIIIFTLSALLFSCESVNNNSITTNSWYAPQKAQDKNKSTIKIIDVSVDKNSSWESVKNEIRDIAPLYFWKYKILINDSENADYAAVINVRERDLGYGFKIKKSLAVEVRIWRYQDVMDKELSAYSVLPISTSRMVIIGNKSFTSSKTAGTILKKVINKALRKIPANKKLQGAKTSA
jgi:hypothetical protein